VGLPRADPSCLCCVPFSDAVVVSLFEILGSCRALVHWYQSVLVKRGDVWCLIILVDFISCVTKLAVLMSDCCWLFLTVGAGYLKSGCWLGQIRGKCAFFYYCDPDFPLPPNYVPWYTGTSWYQ
jgi:hypothetical protein